MKEYDVVVIGGSAAGIPAAITSRRHYPNKSVALIRKEEQVLIPCGIPYIFGTVMSPEKNLIPDGVLEKNGIDLIKAEVTAIDPKQHVVTSSAGEVKYQKLVIATGSLPAVPPIPGIDKQGIFPINKDVAYLNDVLKKMDQAKDLIIVGCGFIGVEFAEECRKRKPDVNITIVEMLKHCLQLVYDMDFCITAEKTLKGENIDLLLDESVVEFTGDKAVDCIVMKSGKKIKADMVIVGIGAVANRKLADDAGLEIGPTKGIQVNRYLQTSDKDIYACGDCAEKVSFFDGKPSKLKLASIATMEARIAGANLFTFRRQNMGAIGVYSTKLGNIAFAGAGLTEALAQEMGYNTVVGEAESVNRHPGGMEGAENLKVKLIFERDNQTLIGGQVCGAFSGGELINAISACISQKMKTDDIAMFQTGTHPALTASPIAYQLVNAAEMAIKNMKA